MLIISDCDMRSWSMRLRFCWSGGGADFQLRKVWRVKVSGVFAAEEVEMS